MLPSWRGRHHRCAVGCGCGRVATLRISSVCVGSFRIVLSENIGVCESFPYRDAKVRKPGFSFWPFLAKVVPASRFCLTTANAPPLLCTRARAPAPPPAHRCASLSTRRRGSPPTISLCVERRCRAVAEHSLTYCWPNGGGAQMELERWHHPSTISPRCGQVRFPRRGSSKYPGSDPVATCKEA